MFTGIVEEVGVVREKIPVGPAMRFQFLAVRIAQTLHTGDSVSCNGVCLTAEKVTSDGFTATAVPETLARTALGEIEKGHIVNLEAAIKAGAPMGGHIVQGHVDGVAEVVGIRELTGGGGKELSVRIPMAFTRYCVEKGSLALHGVSLTIAGVESDILRFAIVPHTLAHTNLANVGPGKRLNFEVDLVGKYVEKLLGFAGVGGADGSDGKGRKGVDPGSLEKWGYGV